MAGGVCLYLFPTVVQKAFFFFFCIGNTGIWKEKLGMTCVNLVIKERL